MGSTIITAPFWSAFTEAWVKEDYIWIKHKMSFLINIFVLIVFISFFMLFFSKTIINLWVGYDLNIKFSLLILTNIWVIINIWGSIFSQFLNGVGKVTIQMNIGILSAIINIPLALYLGKIFGIEGVLIANILVTIIGVWIYPYQYYLLIHHKATGVWAK
jgi:O-antigen/teichoic acid export membrane protein